jgi:hypothetical protein
VNWAGVVGLALRHVRSNKRMQQTKRGDSVGRPGMVRWSRVVFTESRFAADARCCADV